MKKSKIDKHMELGLYCQPIINFQGPKSNGTNRGMYVKILICSRFWKNSTSTTDSSPMSSIFQVNLVFFQPPNFLLPRNKMYSTFWRDNRSEHYFLLPMALLPPTNHPRMECEKTQINNSFESILDEDVQYSIVVKNITARRNKGYVQSICNTFIYI